ncbi:MAG: asparaginase [Myxococcota bacterium]
MLHEPEEDVAFRAGDVRRFPEIAVSSNRKKVLLLHTGGTLMMRSGDARPLAVPPRSIYVDSLLEKLPVLADLAEIHTRVLYQIDSSDMQPEQWVAVAQVIHDLAPDYDGIVIVHGTDTMAYTASALAFLLPDLDRPIVLTGSQRPLDQIRSDARQNLIDAFQLALRPIPEVGIAFNAKLWRGCRTTKFDAWGLDAFDAPMCPPLARLGVDIDIGAHVLPPRTRRRHFDDRLEPNVLAVRIFPGLDPRLLIGAIDAGVRGIVLKAFGAGNVPQTRRSLLPVIEHATARDTPVVIASQCHRAHVDLERYEGGRGALDVGAIGAADMTDEAALTKLMVALGRVARGQSRIASARAAFATDVAGEVTLPR